MKTIACIILALFTCCASTTLASDQLVKIFYEKDAKINLIGEAQVEIVSATGLFVLIDVAMPNAIHKLATKQASKISY